MASLIEKITHVIRPAIESRGYWLVRAKIQPPKLSALQVMCERQDEQPMGMNDCAILSRAISAILDVEDLIPKAYILEVSSPGVERPLTIIEDFQRFVGREAIVELHVALGTRADVALGTRVDAALGTQKSLKGMIHAVHEGTIHLDLHGEIVSIPYEHIKRANLTYAIPRP